MEDESISMFCAFTEASPAQAQQFLALTDGNVEQAVELFFNSPELGSASAAPSQPQRSNNRVNPITIDDDEDAEQSNAASRQTGGQAMEDDEAMARRLQEEMYGGSGGGSGRSGSGAGADMDDVRAPLARTTETLVGPGSDWRDDPNEMNAAIAEQMMARHSARAQARPGIFNQREDPSIWASDDPSNPQAHREVLSRATGGASNQTSKANLLADLFRPPFDLISHLPLSDARDEGKEQEKWILINVQDPSIFDCQVLNRDIWKNASIRDTIKEHFIFLQFNKGDPRGQEYVNYYFSAMHESEDSYPHIAIVDPRTGEQVKTWSGSPGPKASDFLMDLHEFLDRYSLNMNTKNPVQGKRKEKKKDVAAMSEEEMLEMAMQNSLDPNGAPKEEDPDALTRPSAGTNGKTRSPVASAEDTPDPGTTSASGRDDLVQSPTPKPSSPFAKISSSNPHEEPTSADPTQTTRIQFRYSGGRIVRRFLLSDTIRRLYEWLKASPIEGKDGVDFELISMGKNLIDTLDVTINEAGLKQGTVMVELLED